MLRFHIRRGFLPWLALLDNLFAPSRRLFRSQRLGSRDAVLIPISSAGQIVLPEMSRGQLLERCAAFHTADSMLGNALFPVLCACRWRDTRH